MSTAGPLATAASIRERTAELAVLAAAAGLLALIPGLPVAVRGLLVAAFVLLGPGAAVLAHTDLPLSTRAFGVPCLGVAAVLLATWATSETFGLSPTLVLVVLAIATVLVAAPLTRPGLRWRS